MRRSYLLLIFVVLLSGMFGSLRADYPKFPLMERFTNAGCGPCASYNEAGYSAWVAANHNKLAIISYQVDWPGVDSMNRFNPILPDTRVNFYNATDKNGIDGVPSVAFNGVVVGYNEKQDAYGNWSINSQPQNDMLDSLLETESAKRSPMNVTPTLEIAEGVAKIHVDVVSDEAMDNIRLQVLILESVVTYNVAPGSNGERVFPYVARYAKPNMSGTSFTIGAGETKEFNFDQALDARLHTERLYVVAFVEPSNSSKSNIHSIIQAGMSAATVPMPPVVEPEVAYAQTEYYVQVKKDSVITHTFSVTNTLDYDIQLKNIKVTNTFDEDWEFVSTTVPDLIPTIKPGEELVMEYKLKYIGEEPSSAAIYVSFETWMSDEEFASLTGDKVRLPMPRTFLFADISDNSKYAYITGLSNGDKNTYSAFSSATYFNEKLVEIPYFGLGPCYYLFATTKVIDSLEFLGLYSDDYFWLDDALNGGNVMNKIKAMPNLKWFLNLSGNTYFNLAVYMQYNDTKPYCDTANKFIIDMFGVGPANITNYRMQAYNSQTGNITSVSLTGVENDPIAAAAQSLTLNGNEATFWVAYMCLFDIASTTTTSSVYTTNYSLLNRTIMAKYQNSDTRRVITGFDFSTMHNQPATARPIEIVANSIVDWLFDVNVIEDAEENLNPTNGLLLQTQPNPVTDVSDVIVQNTNNMPVQAKVYLLDASGNKVMDLFEGTLGIGNNNISLSNRNIAAGTYFIISETATGKTYMSVAISK